MASMPLETVLTLAAQTLGVELARLRELAQADREGRVVVLPCKLGDTVYFRTYRQNAAACVGVQPHTIRDIRTVCIAEGEHADVELSADQFGKTVFLTREEAEKALEGNGHDEV